MAKSLTCCYQYLMRWTGRQYNLQTLGSTSSSVMTRSSPSFQRSFRAVRKYSEQSSLDSWTSNFICSWPTMIATMSSLATELFLLVSRVRRGKGHAYSGHGMYSGSCNSCGVQTRSSRAALAFSFICCITPPDAMGTVFDMLASFSASSSR